MATVDMDNNYLQVDSKPKLIGLVLGSAATAQSLHSSNEGGELS